MSIKEKSDSSEAVANEAVATEVVTDTQSHDFAIVTLEKPIPRGDKLISSLTVRRPNAGALRGLSLMDVATMNVTTLQKLLPRITSPTLTETDIALHLDVVDLTALGMEVASFLVKKQDRQAFQ